MLHLALLIGLGGLALVGLVLVLLFIALVLPWLVSGGH